MDQDTKLKMQGNWNQLKGKVRQQWGELTDDELDQTQGQWEQVVGKIQERTGQRREEIERQLEEMSAAS